MVNDGGGGMDSSVIAHRLAHLPRGTFHVDCSKAPCRGRAKNLQGRARHGQSRGMPIAWIGQAFVPS